MKVKLKVVVHHCNQGDGSNTVALYNSREYFDPFQLAAIESYEDPYMYGTLSDEEIEIEVDESTGIAFLVGDVRFSSDG